MSRSEQLGVLTDLRDEGKLDLIGISTVPTDMVEAALAVTPIAEVQNAFSIANHTDQPVLDRCRAHDIREAAPAPPRRAPHSRAPPPTASAPAADSPCWAPPP